MTGGKHTVILVHSTSYAIRAERVLNMAEIPSKLIPVPRHLSSDCGVCVRIERAEDILFGVFYSHLHDLASGRGGLLRDCKRGDLLISI